MSAVDMVECFRIWLSELTIADRALHLGYALIALGVFLLAKGSILGWVSRFLGGLICIAAGWHIGLSSIWIWGTLFTPIEIYGFHSWWKNRGVS